MSRMGEYVLELQEAEDALESHIFNTTQRYTHHEHRDNDFGAERNRENNQLAQHAAIGRTADPSSQEAAAIPI